MIVSQTAIASSKRCWNKAKMHSSGSLWAGGGGIRCRTLPDDETPVAEEEFANGTARVELSKRHGPEEHAVGGNSKIRVV
jgi:hypothetical protein